MGVIHSNPSGSCSSGRPYAGQRPAGGLPLTRTCARAVGDISVAGNLSKKVLETQRSQPDFWVDTSLPYFCPTSTRLPPDRFPSGGYWAPPLAPVLMPDFYPTSTLRAPERRPSGARVAPLWRPFKMRAPPPPVQHGKKCWESPTFSPAFPFTISQHFAQQLKLSFEFRGIMGGIEGV